MHGEDEGRAAGVGSDEGTGLVERLVDIRAHDLDERFADGEDVEVHASVLEGDLRNAAGEGRVGPLVVSHYGAALRRHLRQEI